MCVVQFHGGIIYEHKNLVVHLLTEIFNPQIVKCIPGYANPQNTDGNVSIPLNVRRIIFKIEISSTFKDWMDTSHWKICRCPNYYQPTNHQKHNHGIQHTVSTFAALANLNFVNVSMNNLMGERVLTEIINAYLHRLCNSKK